MRFYTKHHRFYCGIDLPRKDNVRLYHGPRRNDPYTPERAGCDRSPRRYAPTLPGDLVLRGVYLYCTGLPTCAAASASSSFWPRSVHEGDTRWKGEKRQNRLPEDRLPASQRNAPMAYTYPQGNALNTDLLRRRLYLSRHHAQLQTHIQNTNTQYNLPSSKSA